MALRDLVEGECGGANSLVRLTTHFVQDRAHKEEGLRHHFPQHSEDNFAEANANELVQEFLEETLVQRGISATPQTFHMDSLLQEMREIECARQCSLPPIPAPGVAQALADQDSACWAEQYLDSGKQFDNHKIESIWNDADKMEPPTSSRVPGQEEVCELGFGPSWTLDYLEPVEDDALPRDFENAWKEGSIESSEIRDQANELVKAVEDPKISYSKFMKFMKKVGNGEIVIEDGEVHENESTHDQAARSWVQEFSEEHKTESAASQWTSDFQTNIDKVDKEKDSQFWSHLQEEWQRSAKEGGLLGDSPWLEDFSEFYEPFNKEYKFEKENPMLEIENPLEEGQKKLAAGDLPSAVLLFEAAAQKDATCVEAWQLLGTSQAENEQDPSAIPALKKCLQLDPGNPTALMALAVCYTNENYQNQACHALKEWLKSNPKYKDLVPESIPTESTMPRIGSITSLLSGDIHKEVQGMYLQAARRNPMESIDPDIQCGLGVLFNLSNEYDKAVDCFKAALYVRPTDSRMWNRLGATLANGNRSEEAVDAYHHALQLSPGFIRARYNVGITCVNLGAHREAAEHLLTALNQQAAGKGPQGRSSWAQMSDSIWSTLRLVVSLMEKQDLFTAVDRRDLAKLNEEFGID